MSHRTFLTEQGETVAVIQDGDYTRTMENGKFTGCFWLTESEQKQVEKAENFEEIQAVLECAQRSKIYD